MPEILYGAELANHFREKGNEKLARIFERNEELPLPVALSLARCNGYRLQPTEIKAYLHDFEPEAGSEIAPEAAAGGDHEVKANEIAYCLACIRDYGDLTDSEKSGCTKALKNFEKLGEKAVQRTEALKLLPKGLKGARQLIEDMYDFGFRAVMSWVESDVSKGHKIELGYAGREEPESGSKPRKKAKGRGAKKGQKPGDGMGDVAGSCG